VTLLSARSPRKSVCSKRFASEILRQGLKGAMRTQRAERGDRTGSSLAWLSHANPAALYVGAPGEDLGRLRDAGVVLRFGTSGRGCSGDRSKDNGRRCASVISQSSPGVTGKRGAGHAFGTSVALKPLDGGEQFEPVIGVPGDDDGRGRVVSLVPGSDLSWVRPARGDGYGRVAPVG
jgi:hypothetical protein